MHSVSEISRQSLHYVRKVRLEESVLFLAVHQNHLGELSKRG